MKFLKKLTQGKKKAPNTKNTVAGLVLIGIILVLLALSTIQEFPWNGNPIAWLQAREDFNQGQKLAKEHNSQLAMAHFQKAIVKYPKDYRFHHALGRALFRSSRAKEAQEAFTKASELAPMDSDVWLDLAYLQFCRNDLSNAEKSARKALSLNTTSATCMALLAVIENLRGSPKEADRIMDTTRSLDRDDARYWFLSAKYFLDRKLKQETLASLRQAATIDSTNPDYQAALGVYLGRLQEYEEAEKCLRKATDLDPNQSEYWTKLGSAQVMLKKMPAAIESYAKATELQPKNSQYWTNLALVYKVTNNLEKAEECLRQIIQLNPRDDSAWDAYINLLRGQNKLELAESELKRYLAMPNNDKNFRTWVYMGDLLQFENKVAEAKPAYERAIALHPPAKALDYINRRLKNPLTQDAVKQMLKDQALKEEALKQEALKQEALKQQEAIKQQSLKQEAIKQGASRIP